MMGLPGNDAPGCFWRADVDEAARELLRGHPRGPAAGHGQLRRATGSTGTPTTSRPTGSPGGPSSWPAALVRQVLRDGHAAVGAGRRPSRAGRRPAASGSGRVESVDDAAVRDPRRAGDHRDRRPRLPGRQAGRDARARHPDRRWTARSSRCPTGSGQRALGTEYYTLLAGRRSRPRPPRAAARSRAVLGVGPVRRDWLACVRGPSAGRLPAAGRVAPGRRPATTGGAYVVLLLLGVARPLIGCFQYSRGPGPGGRRRRSRWRILRDLPAGRLGNADGPGRAYARCGLVWHLIRAGHGNSGRQRPDHQHDGG